MILRQKTTQILDFINRKEKNKNVLIVDGVRQVGKTSAIRLALQQSKLPYLEMNLETQKLFRDQLEQTMDFSDYTKLLKREFNFIPSSGTILFIDEANESLRLGHYIRQMKEDWVDQTVILSGSMMHRLFRDKELRIPVGRYENLTLQPFNFSEFLQANEATKTDLTRYGLNDLTLLKEINFLEHQTLLMLLQHYLTCGGVPQITLGYLSAGENRQQWLAKSIAQYLSTLKDDFLKLFSEEYGNFFLRVITTVANLQGYPFKKSAVVKNNSRLAENLLAVFEGWKFVTKIEQKSFSTTDSISLHPKRYLFDLGVARNQREMALPTIDILHTLQAQHREPLGGLMEQLLCCELSQNFPQLAGYRESTYEVDFVLKWKNMTLPVECKASLKPNQNQYRCLDLYHKRFGNPVGIVVSLAPYSLTQRADYQILHLPAYALGSLEQILKELV